MQQDLDGRMSGAAAYRTGMTAPRRPTRCDAMRCDAMRRHCHPLGFAPGSAPASLIARRSANMSTDNTAGVQGGGARRARPDAAARRRRTPDTSPDRSLRRTVCRDRPCGGAIRMGRRILQYLVVSQLPPPGAVCATAEACLHRQTGGTTSISAGRPLPARPCRRQ